MPRILDTTPAFDTFARKVALHTPMQREGQWHELYESQFPEVFEVFNAEYGSAEGRTALAKELSNVRQRVVDAAPVMRDHIEAIDPSLAKALDVALEPSPLHVLLVGSFMTNAAVSRVGDDVAVFHCLEWFQSPEGAKVLVAHESTHAWCELATGEVFPEDDAAAMAFAEGVAIEASRQVVPDQPDQEYFWYGHPDVDDWLPWCREHRDKLVDAFATGLDAPETVEAFFGGGFVETRWRVGYFVADEIVRHLGLPLPELAHMTVAEGQAAVRAALGVSPPG
ncbi:MAG TPA: hypothetical protein VHS52_04465 [Acidimicrobiales bacterium]|jgi:hypothetical protein|nr:hypothetical protein [Acidimicrobiales bacterium]